MRARLMHSCAFFSAGRVSVHITTFTICKCFGYATIWTAAAYILLVNGFINMLVFHSVISFPSNLLCPFHGLCCLCVHSIWTKDGAAAQPQGICCFDTKNRLQKYFGESINIRGKYAMHRYPMNINESFFCCLFFIQFNLFAFADQLQICCESESK